MDIECVVHIQALRELAEKFKHEFDDTSETCRRVPLFDPDRIARDVVCSTDFAAPLVSCFHLDGGSRCSSATLQPRFPVSDQGDVGACV